MNREAYDIIVTLARESVLGVPSYPPSPRCGRIAGQHSKNAVRAQWICQAFESQILSFHRRRLRNSGMYGLPQANTAKTAHFIPEVASEHSFRLESTKSAQASTKRLLEQLTGSSVNVNLQVSKRTSRDRRPGDLDSALVQQHYLSACSAAQNHWLAVYNGFVGSTLHGSRTCAGRLPCIVLISDSNRSGCKLAQLPQCLFSKGCAPRNRPGFLSRSWHFISCHATKWEH